MLTTILLTLRIAALLTTTGHDATDAALYATVCVRESTPLVSPERLCAVAYVESKMTYRAVNAGGHCGAWQQHPRWTRDFGDAGPVSCEELMDVPTAARVAARHLTRLESRPRGDRTPLCRYAGATGERCRDYTLAVTRAESRLTR
jgi:hypothetical protein